MFVLAVFLINVILITDSYGEELSSSTIEISTGTLQGFHAESYDGRIYTAFEGIPFARPPVGELRFQAPKESYNWTGTWIANTKHACVSFPYLNFGTSQSESEDCLYLNVYVPRENLSTSDNFDVVVHIHGGAFMIGYPHAWSGPKYLMDRDVVYVSFSYRLGPLGFLSTEDEILPGNNGLKDQSLALKWIQNNIKYFGGNPDSVTITGVSAGGASVHYHYFSLLSKGLFHRGYSASGTALDPWALQDSPLLKAKKLASLLGCSSETSQDILNCVMQRSSKSIHEAGKHFVVKGMPFSPFGPVIEPKHKGAFITRNPYSMLLDGVSQDLPWLVSITKDEGVYPAGFFYNELTELDQNWESIAPHLLDFNYTIPNGKTSSVAQKIKKQYFGKKEISKDTFQKLIKLCGDRHFYRGFEKAIKLQRRVSKAPIYAFMFAYSGRDSLSQIFGYTEKKGATSHGDDSLFYLSNNKFESELEESDEEVKDVVVDFITSFAKEKVPKIKDVKWEPVSSGKLKYLYIDGANDLKMKEVEDLGSNSFWKDLPLKENEDLKSKKDEL